MSRRLTVLVAANLVALVALVGLGAVAVARQPGARPAVAYSADGAYLEIGAGPDVIDGGTVIAGPDGLPRVHYAGDLLAENPVTTIQYGLQQFSRWADGGDQRELANATRAADWLVERQEADGSWRYGFDYALHHADISVSAGWVSALAQGQAMSLLTRVADATGDRRYVEAAKRALMPLERTVADGGVQATFRGHLFLEEYPTNPRTLVLNGFMSTLLGLHDLARTGDTAAHDLFREGRQTLDALLPLYDQGEDATYDLTHLTAGREPFVSVGYRRGVVALLGAIQAVAPSPTVEWYRTAWRYA